MKVKVLIEYTLKNVCSEQDLKDTGKTVEEITRWLIKQEGSITCLTDDKGKIAMIWRMRK